MRSCHRFPGGIPHPEADLHVLLTRPPLPLPLRTENVRLACVRHAASVDPGSGSNSPSSSIHTPLLTARENMILGYLCCPDQDLALFLLFLVGSQIVLRVRPDLAAEVHGN